MDKVQLPISQQCIGEESATDQIRKLLLKGKKPKEIIGLGFAKSTVYQVAKKGKRAKPAEEKTANQTVRNETYAEIESILKQCKEILKVLEERERQSRLVTYCDLRPLRSRTDEMPWLKRDH
jgi:hypothetical protein